MSATDGRIFLELAVVGAAEDLAGQGAKGKHWIEPLIAGAGSVVDLRMDAKALGPRSVSAPLARRGRHKTRGKRRKNAKEANARET